MQATGSEAGHHGESPRWRTAAHPGTARKEPGTRAPPQATASDPPTRAVPEQYSRPLGSSVPKSTTDECSTLRPGTLQTRETLGGRLDLNHHAEGGDTDDHGHWQPLWSASTWSGSPSGWALFLGPQHRHAHPEAQALAQRPDGGEHRAPARWVPSYGFITKSHRKQRRPEVAFPGSECQVFC